MNVERTMEIDPTDLELMCWLMCGDIEEDYNSEEKEEKDDGARIQSI